MASTLDICGEGCPGHPQDGAPTGGRAGWTEPSHPILGLEEARSGPG